MLIHVSFTLPDVWYLLTTWGNALRWDDHCQHHRSRSGSHSGIAGLPVRRAVKIITDALHNIAI